MKELLDYLKLVADKRYIVNMLYWEMDTITPDKNIDYVSELLSKLSTELFELTTCSKYKKLLDNVIDSDEFNSLSYDVRTYLLKLRDDYCKNKRIPVDFYKEYKKLMNDSKNAWSVAKDKNDYDIFKPYLEKMILMTKRYYNYMYPDKENNYDAMIGEYEKGITSDFIDSLFDKLKREIIPIVKSLDNKKLDFIDKKFSDSQLKSISEYLLKYIGFDNDRGALGIYPHGYTTTLNINDVRIAYSNNRNIIDHMCTVIHEGGHGIFEQNIGDDLRKIPIYDIDKISLHESQSRFYENILGRNINFWIPIYDDIKKLADIDLPINEFIKYLNNAQPSLIRTEADELTYCLHIIIRYEIERDLFGGKIGVDDLPRVWNEKYRHYLGVNVNNYREGILQDVHWAEGAFGYFPSYLLGTIFDGMLLDNINRNVGDVSTVLKDGKISEITRYLNNLIHCHGGTYNINEVSKRMCGKDLSVSYIIDYFKNKYIN